MNTHASGRGAKDPVVGETSAPVAPGPVLRPILLLYVLVIAAQFISLAFGRIDNDRSLAVIALPSLVFLSVLTLPACWVGIVLGRKVGLGVPRSDAPWSKQPDSTRDGGRDVMLACALGLLLGGALLALRVQCQPYLSAELPALGFRGAIGGWDLSPRSLHICRWTWSCTC